jgi:HEAT repeat protein
LLVRRLHELRQIDKSDVPQIVELTQHEDADVRRAAINALNNVDQDQFQIRVVEALNDSDSDVVIGALNHLVLNAMKSAEQSDDWESNSSAPAFPVEKYLALLFHKEPKVQRSAILHLRHIRPIYGDQVATKLVEVLNDETRSQDRLMSIRLLGLLGETAKASVPNLVQIVKETDDAQLRAAAAVALDQIDPQKGQGRFLLLDGVVGDEQGERIEQMNEEFRKVHENRR